MTDFPEAIGTAAEGAGLEQLFMDVTEGTVQ